MYVIKKTFKKIKENKQFKINNNVPYWQHFWNTENLSWWWHLSHNYPKHKSIYKSSCIKRVSYDYYCKEKRNTNVVIKSRWIVVKYDIELFLWLNEQLKGWVSAKRKEEKITMKKELEISKSRSIEVSISVALMSYSYFLLDREN